MNPVEARLRRAQVRFFDKGNFAGTSGLDLRSILERNQSPIEARIPPFRLHAVPIMLNDEYIVHGLTMIAGPIMSNLKVEIVAAGAESENSRVVKKGKKAGGSLGPGQGDGKNPFGAKDATKKTDTKNPSSSIPSSTGKSGEALAAAPPFSLQEGNEVTPVDEEESEVDPDEDGAFDDSLALGEPRGLPPEVESYIEDNLNLFIDNCLEVALTNIIFGYSPSEPCFDFDEDVPYLHHLESIDPFACEPYVDQFGRFDGIKVTKSGGNVLPLKDFMGYPKAFWTVHDRHVDKWFGRSRLRAAYPTFYKKWSKKGLGEMLRIWITKCAYDSGTLYYDTQNAPTVNGVPSTDNFGLAKNILNQSMTGSGRILPSDVDPITQKERWKFDPAQASQPPGILLESLQDSDSRMLLAMGVSPELVQNFSTGGGFGSASGRAIPETAFYSTLMAIIKPIVCQDFKEQIMDKLIFKRFGRKYSYRLVILPLMGDDQSSSTDPPPFKPEEVGGEGSSPFSPSPEGKDAASKFASAKFGSAA